jgi:eukaryotic-like serine/threonine-protein kinase
VKDVLLRRLRRLDETCRRVLAIAAVARREFTFELVERVAAMPAEEVAESLEDAIAARIVEEADPIGRYSFAHALIRETIYEQLSRTRRAQLHLMIGEALESNLGERAADSASELAYHFSEAGDAARAYGYHAIAAAAAGRVYAVEAGARALCGRPRSRRRAGSRARSRPRAAQPAAAARPDALPHRRRRHR